MDRYTIHELKRAATASFEVYQYRLQKGTDTPDQLLRDLQICLDGILTAAVWLSDSYKELEEIERHNDRLINQFMNLTGELLA